MARVALERALKKPGRVLTWHAGAGCRSRSHRRDDREDYFTVLPPHLAEFVHRIGSDTTEPQVLEQFLDDMLHDMADEEAEFQALHADDPLVPVMPADAVLFEIRGYFNGCLEFYVTQWTTPAPLNPFRRSPEPRWLILASPNVRSAERCAVAFDDLLDRCDSVARCHDLILDLETVRDGFRTMLRRKAGFVAPLAC